MGGRLPGTSDMYAYGVYLSVGLIPWKCFSDTVLRSATLFVDKKHIISKIQVSLLGLLFYINLAEMITLIISSFLLLFFLFVTGFELTPKIFFIPLLLFIQQILAYAMGLFAAVLTVFLRDMKELLGVIFQLWFWFTPIIYVLDILPAPLQRIMILNPGYILVNAYHDIFVFQRSPDGCALIVLFILTLLLLFSAISFFKFLEKDIRDFL